MRIFNFPLLDGPLGAHGKIEPRESVVERMADHLVKHDAFANEGDAMRCLMWSGGFSPFHALVLLDDARQAAAQSVVAREMAS